MLRKYMTGTSSSTSVTEILFFLALILLMPACGPKVQDAVGTYKRTDVGLTEEIVLKGDFTFTQTVKYADKRVFKIAGTWNLKYKMLELSRAFVTRDVEHDVIYDPPDTREFVSFTLLGKTLE